MVLCGLSLRLQCAVLCDVRDELIVVVAVVVVVVIIIIINYMSKALIEYVLLCRLRRGNIITTGHIIFVGTKILKLAHLFVATKTYS